MSAEDDKRKEDVQFSTSVKRALGNAKKIEKIVTDCHNAAIGGHVYSERALFTLIEDSLTPDMRLGAAHGSMGEIIGGLLHLLYYNNPTSGSTANESDKMVAKLKVHRNATPACLYGLSPTTAENSVKKTDDSNDFFIEKARKFLTPAERRLVSERLELIVELYHPQYVIPALMSVISPHQTPFQGQKFFYKEAAADMMEEFVLKKDGVLVLVDTLLTDLPPTELSAYQRVVLAVTKIPRFCHSSEDFFKRISPQILKLWTSAEVWKKTHFCTALPMIILELWKKHKKLFNEYIMNVVGLPLICIVRETVETLRRDHSSLGIKGEGVVTVELDCEKLSKSSSVLDDHYQQIFSGRDVVLCVESLHRVVYEYRVKSVFDMFGNFLDPLLHLYSFVYASSMGCRSAVFEIISQILLSDPKKSLLILYNFLSESTPRYYDHFYYYAGVEGGIEVRYGHQRDAGDAYTEGFMSSLKNVANMADSDQQAVMVERRVDSLVEILSYLATKRESSLAGDLLASFLSQDLSVSSTASLVPLKLCLALCQKLGSSCLKTGSQAANLILYLLKSAKQPPTTPESDEAKEEREEENLSSITTALTLLELAMTDKLMLSIEFSKLLQIKEALLETKCSEPEIAQMVATCRIGVTRLVDNYEKKGTPEDVDEDVVATEGTENSQEKILHDALTSLADSDPGRIGHGLLTLTQLIRSAETDADRDSVLRDFPTILDAFTSYLAHDESYIFLSAGKGLTALCEMFPEQSVPAVIERYRPFKTEIRSGTDTVRRARMKQKRSAATQMRDHRLNDVIQETDRIAKLADVLCYVVWRGGITRYAGAIVNALLERCHHSEEELIRASAMQSIATVCLHCAHEMLGSLDSVVCTAFDVMALDNSMMCRRAAMSILYHIFAGLSNDSVVILEKYIPKMFEIARDNLHGKEPVLGEYCRLLLEEGNNLRHNLHQQEEQSLFSRPNNAF